MLFRSECVSRVPKELTAAERARWLAELSEALDEAQEVASRIGLLHMPGAEAMELCLRLAAARAQVQGLQLARPDEDSGAVDPEWTNPPLWPDEPGGNR